MQSYAKAIAAGVMAVAAVVVLVLGTELPSWLNEDWLLAIMAIITPFLVAAIPNQR
jgi:hypothetical protein